MKRKTSFLICLLLCFVAVFFSACGSVRSITISNTDGSIDELVCVELDENAVKTSGYDINRLKADITKTATSKANELVNSFILAMQIKQFETQIKSERDYYAKIIQSIEVVEPEWTNNRCVVGIKFLNESAYNMFYGIEDDSKVEFSEEKHFFYTKTYYTGYSKFVAYQKLTEELKTEYQESYPDLIKEDSGELLYTMASNLRREHSNADYITKQGDIYYHTWVIDSPDEELEIYYNTLNRGNVILVIMGISLGVILILGIIIFIKKKIRKNSQ